jgi:hypothetical protein
VSAAEDEARPVPDRRGVDRLLWLGVMAGPLAFLADLTIRYAMVAPVCEAGDKTALHLATLAAFLLAVVPMGFAWRAWRRLESEGRRSEGERRDWEEPARSRGHFLAMAALALGALSALGILAMTVPGVVLGACQ